MTARYVAAIDQGTTSSRCILFDRDGAIVASAQREHRQIYPRPGWVEHDAVEIWRASREVHRAALADAPARAPATSPRSASPTSARRSSLWERATRRARSRNAIVWQDTRTADASPALADGGPTGSARSTGLPLATYFSGPKLAWLLDARRRARARARRRGEIALRHDRHVARLEPRRGVHVTDVTNASRTLLMDLRHARLGRRAARRVRRPARDAATRSRRRRELRHGACGALGGVPVAGVLGDQQAALFGPGVLRRRARPSAPTAPAASCSLNTGERAVSLGAGLITSVAYRLGDGPAAYVPGGLDRGRRRARAVAARQPRAHRHAPPRSRRSPRACPTPAACYFVPAFSGLFAPHWRSDARGVIVGLTGYATQGAPRARGARGDRLADARGARRDGGGRRRAARRAARRRRHDRERRC